MQGIIVRGGGSGRAPGAGQAAARRRLRRIDPAFSGRGLDPQDVKVLFDPVDYVVFRGQNSGHLREVVLMAHPPSAAAQERAHASIESCVKKGNLEFATLRVTAEGAVERDE